MSKKGVNLQNINVNNFFDQPPEFYDLLARAANNDKKTAEKAPQKPENPEIRGVEDKDKTNELRNLIFGSNPHTVERTEDPDQDDEIKELIMSLQGGNAEKESKNKKSQRGVIDEKMDIFGADIQKGQSPYFEGREEQNEKPMDLKSQLQSALGLSLNAPNKVREIPKKKEEKVDLMSQLFGGPSSSPAKTVHYLALLDQNGLSYGPLPGVCGSEALFSCPGASEFALASNGLLLAAFNPADKFIEVWNLIKVIKKHQFPISQVVSIEFSPLNRFLVVTSKKEDGKSYKTSVLSVKGKKQPNELFSAEHSKFTKAQSPYIKFLEDESAMLYCKVVSSGAEIETYMPITQTRMKGKEKVMDIVGFLCTGSFPTSTYNALSLCSAPGQTPLIFLSKFQNEEKGVLENGSMSVYSLNGSTVFSSELPDSNTILTKHSPLGDKSLTSTELFNDPTGKNYYGKTKLYLLNQHKEAKMIEVETPEGQLHDFSWAPNGDSFVVVAGSMPSKTIVYDSNGLPVAFLCKEYRNKVNFSPKGRFILVYGIGNLPGNFDVYSKEDLTLLGRFRSPSSSVVRWSGDEEYIMTEIVFSKIKENNLFRIFCRDGSLKYKKEYDSVKFYLGEWKPEAEAQCFLMGFGASSSFQVPPEKAYSLEMLRKDNLDFRAKESEEEEQKKMSQRNGPNKGQARPGKWKELKGKGSVAPNEAPVPFSYKRNYNFGAERKESGDSESKEKMSNGSRGESKETTSKEKTQEPKRN